MRALVIDLDGMPRLSKGGGGAVLALLNQLTNDAPDDVRVALRLAEGETISLDDLAAPGVRSRIGLLKLGAKAAALDDYLYAYGPDDFLIVTSSDDFGDFQDRVLFVDRKVGLADPFTQGCIRDWIAGEGLAGDMGSAMAVLRRELARIVAGSGTPPPEGWLGRWLDTEHPALGGAKPADFMNTFPRRLVVNQLLGAIASGAYM
jgi:hypothetical protein